jgi:hypothetical protein
MKLMKIQLMLTAAAALLLGGCTTAYETRGYHDTGGYYAGRDRDYYDGGGYGRSYHDDGSGNYDRDHYNRTNVPEVHTNAVVVHERSTAGSQATTGHTAVKPSTRAVRQSSSPKPQTESHGRSGNKTTASHGGGEHKDSKKQKSSPSP